MQISLDTSEIQPSTQKGLAMSLINNKIDMDVAQGILKNRNGHFNRIEANCPIFHIRKHCRILVRDNNHFK